MKFLDISQTSLKAMINEDIKELDKKRMANHYAIFKEIEAVLSCN